MALSLACVVVGSVKGNPDFRESESGSLTGAVHLSNDNAGVLRLAPQGKKPCIEQKGKSQLEFSFQYKENLGNNGLSILFISWFEERGDRKVTTGITGLWLPSVHSDVAF